MKKLIAAGPTVLPATHAATEHAAAPMRAGGRPDVDVVALRRP
jgi:hypothetical protein